MSARALRALDHDTGELVEASPEALAANLHALRDELHGAERDIKAWRRRCADLERDHEAAAEGDKHWPLAVRLFQHWQTECGHPNSEWKWERFEMVLPFLKGRKYGLEMCLRAIAGARYDPWRKLRRNGTYSRRDGWDAIFGKPGEFEDFCNRAPKGWVLPEGFKEAVSGKS